MRKNLISVDNDLQRVYRHSGLSKAVIKSFSTPASNPFGITTDERNIIIGDATANKIFKQSGFSISVRDSFSTPASDVSGLTFINKIANLPEDGVISSDEVTDRIYRHSGFSKTIRDSFSAIDIITIGLAYDSKNLMSVGSSSDRIFRHSGFSNIVTNSISSPGPTPSGLSFIDKDLLSTDLSLKKFFKHSGFSNTILDSFSTPGADPGGITIETTYSSNDVIELNGGDLLVSFNTGNAGSTFAASIQRYNASNQTWLDTVVVDAGNTNYTHPSIVQLSSTTTNANRIILAMYDNAAQTINIYNSDNNGVDWVLLSTIASIVNAEHLSLTRSADDIVIAYNRGRTCFSRKSTDSGLTWGNENTIASSSYSPTITTLGSDAYGLTYYREDQRVFYASSVNGTTFNVISSRVFGSTDLLHIDPTLIVDSNDDLYCIAQLNSTNDLTTVKSTDNGITWESKAAIAQNDIDHLQGLYTPSATRFQDQLFCIAEAWDGINGHLVSIKSHDWKNITESQTYTDNYEPILGEPSNFGLIQEGTDGSQIVDSGFIKITTISNGTRTFKTKNLENIKDTTGLKSRFEIKVNSGGSLTQKAIAVRINVKTPENQAIDFDIRFNITGFIVHDNSGSDIGASSTTHDMTQKHEFLITIEDTVGSIWFRSTHDNSNKWVSVLTNYSFSLSDQYDYLVSDNNSDKLFRFSGFGMSLVDSFTTRGSLPQDVFVKDGDVYNTDSSLNTVFRYSGFTQTVKDSFTFSAPASPGVTGISFINEDVIACEISVNKIFRYSGFTRVLKDSFALGAITPIGIAYDGTNVYTADLNTRIKKFSGFSSTVLNSFTTITSDPNSLAWNGQRLIYADIETEKVYTLSGFTNIVFNSFLTTDFYGGAGNNASGASVFARLSQIQFGIFNAVADVEFHNLRFVKNDDGLSDSFTNPTDLNQRPTATGSRKQFIKDGIEIAWGGSDGVVNDEWLINSDFQFAKRYMIEDSPSNFWRSTNDNVDIAIVFDAGENKVFDVDMFSLVNTNFKVGRFQMNNANSDWNDSAVDIVFNSESDRMTPTAITEEKVTDITKTFVVNEHARPNQPKFLEIRKNDIINVGAINDKIFKYSNFSQITIDSFSTTGASGTGVAFDGKDLMHVDTNSKKVIKYSAFSNTIKNSFTVAQDFPYGLAWDGQNIFIASFEPDGRIFEYSGFSKVAINSFSSNAGLPTGITFDGTNILIADIGRDRILKSSGALTIDSFSSFGIKPEGLTWDGKFLYNVDAGTNRVYKHSGFNKKILDSFSTADTAPIGLTLQNTPVLTGRIDRNLTNNVTISDKLILSAGANLNHKYTIYSDRIARTLPNIESYRYVRLLIQRQETEDGFYKIGRFIFGTRKQLSKGFNVKFRQPITSNINTNLTLGGQKFTNKQGEPRRGFEIAFNNKKLTFTDEIESLFDHIDWGNNTFIFVKDGSDLTDFILGRLSKNYIKDHVISGIYTVAPITIEEEL